MPQSITIFMGVFKFMDSKM